MPLSPAEARELAKLRADLKRLRRDMADAPQSLGAAGSRIEVLIAEFDRKVQRLTKLEALEHGAELAERQARDEAIRDIARVQAEVAEDLAAAHAAAAKRLSSGVLVRNRADVAKAIRSEMSGLAAFSDGAIRQAMRRVGTVAAALDRELAIRVFGPEVIGEARRLGIAFGGGIDRKLVDDLWAGRDEKLAYLRHVKPAAQLRAGYDDLGRQLSDQVKRLVSFGHDARTSFAALKRAGHIDEAAVPKWIARIQIRARAAFGGDLRARQQLDAALRAARRYVNQRGSSTERRLGTRPAGDRLLRNLDKAIEQLSLAGVDEAVRKWTQQKAAYHAMTWMRTATNETYREQQTRTYRKRPWVYAVRWRLSASHPRLDQCNAWVTADFGLGPGVYPIGRVPASHPSCLCRFEPVIDKHYFNADRKPLAFHLPAGFDEKLSDLSFDPKRKGESLYSQASKAKTDAELRELLRSRGLVGGERVKLRRVARSEAGPDNVLPGPGGSGVAGPRGAAAGARRSSDPIGASAKARQAVRKAEDSIRHLPYERAVFVDPATGRELFAKDGTRRNVVFTFAELRSLAGAIITHNHPSGGTLSFDDIAMASTWGMAEMRATTAGGRTWVMRPPPEGWDKAWMLERLTPSFERADRDLKREFDAEIRAGRMRYDEANARHYDDVWKRVARELGMLYSKEDL